MSTVKRKTRFVPESNSSASISFEPTEFQKAMDALVMNESVNGACLVINKKLLPKRISMVDGLYLLVKVGHLAPELMVVRWAKELGANLIKFGVEREKKEVSDSVFNQDGK